MSHLRGFNILAAAFVIYVTSVACVFVGRIRRKVNISPRGAGSVRSLQNTQLRQSAVKNLRWVWPFYVTQAQIKRIQKKQQRQPLLLLCWCVLQVTAPTTPAWLIWATDAASRPAPSPRASAASWNPATSTWREENGRAGPPLPSLYPNVLPLLLIFPGDTHTHTRVELYLSHCLHQIVRLSTKKMSFATLTEWFLNHFQTPSEAEFRGKPAEKSERHAGGRRWRHRENHADPWLQPRHPGLQHGGCVLVSHYPIRQDVAFLLWGVAITAIWQSFICDAASGRRLCSVSF